MTDREYLEAVLEDQTLAEGSEELATLRHRKNEVDVVLRDRFDFAPSVKYGGSYKKGTMIRESYDVDLTCYFARDEEIAGTSLEAIYESVEAELRSEYWTERKGSAIRLHSRESHIDDFHIDVVPGRFVEGKTGSVHLYRSGGDKLYLKTNLDVHISHVTDSGVVPAIRIAKLWALRNRIGIKTFALELLVIGLLEGRKKLSLPTQFKHVLEEFRDNSETLYVNDPANSNNDLSELLNTSVRWRLGSCAEQTLDRVEDDGWIGEFGDVEIVESASREKSAALRAIALSAPAGVSPWAGR